MSEYRLEYRGVGKTFAAQRNTGHGTTDRVVAVTDVNLAVREHEVVSLIGPSGCGKSTLLNMGAGLYAPTDGDVMLDGKRVVKPDPKVAFMLQKDLLLPWRSIRRNVELGLEIQGVGASQREQRALELLQTCHLTRFAGHYPHQLSGGMRQRAALARTLAVNPAVLLLDEPFSALDAQTKMILQQDLARTLAADQRTAIFITHDLTESITLSDRVVVMSERPGTIIEEIVVDLPDRHDPMTRRAHPRTTDYVNHLMSLLHVSEQTHEDEI